MRISFFDGSVEVTDLTIGMVLFITSVFDRGCKEAYVPCHLKGFSRGYAGELIMVVSSDFDSPTSSIHPSELALYS